MAKVDETEKGWFLAWIDSSPKALEKAVRLLLSLFFNYFFSLSLLFFSFVAWGFVSWEV